MTKEQGEKMSFSSISKCLMTAVLFSIVTVGFAAPQGGIKWNTDYSQAMATAKSEKKPVLLFFTGSDWCGWCKKMDSEIFASPDFVQAVGSKFVFVELDFPMNTKLPEKMASQNQMLKKKFGISGFPTVIILDSSGNFVAETGYQAGGGKAYAQYLQQFVS